MSRITSRRLFASAVAGFAGCAMMVGVAGAHEVTEIGIDWAYYNPVSLVLKEQGWLEEALAERGIEVTWVQSAGSNKAIEFLNSGSIQFGSSAGAAALLAVINGSPFK